jgi:hypothetical protein
MKAGVRISPRGVEMTPVRARPSVALTEKLNPVAILIFLRRAPALREIRAIAKGERQSPAPVQLFT